MLINETAARALGYINPASAVGQRLDLAARPGETRVYWSDQDAVLATEGGDDWLCAPERWRARHALHQQLLSLEVLADNL